MEVFVARQPIFTVDKRVFGYELLYRSGKQNVYDHVDGDQATLDVIANGFSVIGFEVLSGGKPVFINLTQNMLHQGVITAISSKNVIAEILEDVVLDQKTIAACLKLKELGYTIALDDVVAISDVAPMLDLADIIKVDFSQTQPEQWQAIPKTIGTDRIKFLAEKVETLEEYEQAANCGYTYFQGYFFSKPVILSGQDLAPYKLNYFRIIQEINHNGGNVDRIEEIVKQDISLSYRLLKLINSASFGFNMEITSIKYALVLLGVKEFLKWVIVISMRTMVEERPDEVVTLSLIRARFAELLAEPLNLKRYKSDLFLMGMFSMIDALLNQPMVEAVKELPISQEIKNALLGHPNVFRDVYELIVDYEQGNWADFGAGVARMNLNEDEISDLYVDALKWVSQTFK